MLLRPQRSCPVCVYTREQCVTSKLIRAEGQARAGANQPCAHGCKAKKQELHITDLTLTQQVTSRWDPCVRHGTTGAVWATAKLVVVSMAHTRKRRLADVDEVAFEAPVWHAQSGLAAGEGKVVGFGRRRVQQHGAGVDLQ